MFAKIFGSQPKTVWAALAVCAVMEFAGYFFYYQLGDQYFRVLDILPVMIACVYGLRAGLLCLAPAAVSEILWVIRITAPGPAINLTSFVLTNIIAGTLSQSRRFSGTAARVALFESSLLLLRVFMCSFRLMLSMEPVSVTHLLLSLHNIVFLALMIFLLRGASFKKGAE